MDIGFKSGMLTVISDVPQYREIGKKKERRPYYLCRCHCGGEKYICIGSLKYKTTKSCGCMSRVWRRDNNPNKYDVVDDFFDTWSHDMAYILGFLTADGCISRDGGQSCVRASIHQRDIALLEYMRSCICPDKPIERNPKRTVVELRWSSQHQVKILEQNFGLVSRKSLIIRCQFDIPSIYFGDYLRGLFDGDGSYSLNKQWSKPRLRSTLYSGSKDFLLDIQEKVGPYGSIHRKPGGGCYSWVLAHQDSLRLRDIVYYNHSGFSLKRKRDFLFDYERIINGQ